MRDEYEALIASVRADANWSDADPADVLESCKGVVTVFTVVQATARKLQQHESRSKVVKAVVTHAKASTHWASFSNDLIQEIDDFQKEVDGNDVPRQ